MTQEAIKDILATHGHAEAVDNQLEIAGDFEVSLIAVLGQENLLIDRIRSVQLGKDYMVASTRRERYILAYEDVRAVRVGLPESAGYTG